jgi:hypothetical protein
MVDVFVAAAGQGWEGGTTHGMAFTWALAVALHPWMDKAGIVWLPAYGNPWRA